MNHNVTIVTIPTPVVMNWGYLENWKSTAPVVAFA